MIEEIVRGMMSNGLWATLIASAAAFVLLRLLGNERADRLKRDEIEETRSLRRHEQYQAIIATMQAIASGQAVLAKASEEIKAIAAGEIKPMLQQIHDAVREIDRPATRRPSR